MDTERLYVMIGLLVFGLCGTVYFLQSYISTKKRKSKEREETKKEREYNDLWIERKTRARMSVYEFRKKAHLINPITFSNGITVSFVERKMYVTDLMNYVKFGIEYEIKGEIYYDAICHNGTLSNIYIDDKYSLEDLEGYDWIIETAYNLTEDRINKIQKDRVEEELFVKNIDNNELVTKINQ